MVRWWPSWFCRQLRVWARTRVNEDLADRNERAQLAVEEFESDQGAETIEAEPGSTTATVAAEAGPSMVTGEALVVHGVPGDDYGRLAIRHTDGTRTLLDRSCMRAHIAGDHGVCLSEAPRHHAIIRHHVLQRKQFEYR